MRLLIAILFVFHFAPIKAKFTKNYFAEELTEKDIAYFRSYEIRLQSIQKKLFKEKTDSLKLKLNETFFSILDTVLSAERSFYYPFDSLTEIVKLTSPDNLFRIINWNIYKSDGSYWYYGFIQTYRVNEKKYEYFKLIDRSESIKNPETFVGEPEKWFGMLYYKIVKNSDYYTLLGWDGNTKISQRKFIEILYFKKNGDPVFGKDVFKVPRKNPRRIVFDYSSDLTMSLKYIEDKKMIVFDHLAPREAHLEGQFQFYGPDFSYDAFEYHKQKWKYIMDVDIKNLKNKNDNIKHRENKKEKRLYVPN